MATMQGTILKPEVKDFKRLRLRIHNHVCALSISQGEKEAIILKGPSQLLMRINPCVQDDRLEVELDGSLTDRIGDTFSTSLSRQKIWVDLKVRTLSELDLGGFIEGVITALEVDDLKLAFTGLGNLKIGEIRSRRLRSILKGTPSVQIGGRVDEQLVKIKGMGQYRAGELQTQKTKVEFSGSAFATLWVEKELEIDMHGMGSIEYYGRPSISRRMVGMNNLKALGER